MNAAPARAIRSAVTAFTMLAVSLGVVAVGATPAAAGTKDSYTVTKYSNTWNGGCEAQSTVTYWPGSDTATFTTRVTSPYLFAACRVHTRLYVQGKSTQWTSATTTRWRVGSPTRRARPPRPRPAPTTAPRRA